jgi:hypothetical protein
MRVASVLLYAILASGVLLQIRDFRHPEYRFQSQQHKDQFVQDFAAECKSKNVWVANAKRVCDCAALATAKELTTQEIKILESGQLPRGLSEKVRSAMRRCGGKVI